MFGLSTQIFDLSGARIFTNTITVDGNRSGSRRNQRTATLDGGVVITDMGYCDGDRDLTIKVPEASLADIEYAKYIVENYNIVTVTTDEGVFSAAPGPYEANADGTLIFKLSIKEKLSL